VPLIELLQPALGLSFAPAGHTDDPEIPRVHSVAGYVARRLAVDWLSHAQRAAIGVLTTSELGWQGGREQCDPQGREVRQVHDRRVSSWLRQTADGREDVLFPRRAATARSPA
jgi:hypothetical protein